MEGTTAPTHRTLSDAELDTLRAARVTLRAIASRALYGTPGTPSTQADGMVYALAEEAETSIFKVINHADSWWHLGIAEEKLFVRPDVA